MTKLVAGCGIDTNAPGSLPTAGPADALKRLRSINFWKAQSLGLCDYG